MKKEQIESKKAIVKKRYVPSALENDISLPLGYNLLLAFDVLSENNIYKIIAYQNDIYSSIYTNNEVKLIKYKYIFEDYYEMKSFLKEEIKLNYPNLIIEEQNKKLSELLPNKALFKDKCYSVIKYEIEKEDEKHE